ncbi:MFS transporter [Amycolatopsis deserti]|uniref:MFS transporter n=1 Tax=Amycolatopsis deserti TaxID=185696 RepID=A0ABQ3IFZ8_9PSEU|nr:MFS transporter [Amycolatopsis deserti]GHE78742.1 MFS transporter [Amycolatopsis deserti]
MPSSEDLLPGERKSYAYQWYVVAVCMVAYVFSFVDRQILSLMIEPIKRDLHLSDTQFSLLNGLAFSLLYSVMGLPIAILADKRSRPLIISIGVAFWSLATAASGLAKGFVHLFCARIGVGVGEAALSPAAYSMFSDMFPKSKLGRAYGIYSLGSFIGGAAAFVIGGYVINLLKSVDTVTLPLIGEVRAWQLTFLIVGLPGIVLAVLVFLTVRDPRRRGLQRDADGGVRKVALRHVFAFLWRHRRTFTAHYLGFSLYALVLLGMMAWTPAFYIRAFGLTSTQAGYLLGVVVLVANGSGVLFGGWLVDLLARRGHPDAAMRAGVIGALGMIVPVVVFTQAGQLWLSLVLLAVAMFFASFPMPASTAAMQVLSPNQMRAQVSAIFLLISNLIALALGTTLVALVTDRVFGDPKMVGSSLSIVYGLASVATVLLLWRGCRHFRHSLAAERETGERAAQPEGVS